MTTPLILASGSNVRSQLLRQGGVPFEIIKPKLDEAAMRAALQAEEATPRDIADTLAEAKARKVAGRYADRLVLGCDQILHLKGTLFHKPESPEHLITQLRALSGQTHHLLSAAVLYENAKPVWRHVGVVRMTMAQLSDDEIAAYVAAEWDTVRHSVGGYHFEGAGVRLFARVSGDYHSILGLPLLELLSYLRLRGIVPA